MHTAVAVGGQVKTLRTLRPRTAGSQTVSQFSVAAVKTEEDAMDDDFEGHDDSVSVEPKHRYHTDEELGEDEGPKKRQEKGTKSNNGGTKCRVCKKSYYFGAAKHQKVCKVLVLEDEGPKKRRKKGAARHQKECKMCTCSYCGEAFNNWQSLTCHERNHSVTKYSCTFCDKTFIYNTGRIAHEHRQHSNTKYGCSDCGKMFEEHLERDQHECIVFTGSFAFSCTECNKGFKRQYILKKHQLAEHPEIFSNKQKVQVEAMYMYGQDIVIDQHSETDMGLTNQVNEQDMGLNIQVNKQDMGLKREVHEQDMGLKHQDYGQDIGLNNQVNEQGKGLNIQVNEQDMGLMSQGYEIDILSYLGL